MKRIKCRVIDEHGDVTEFESSVDRDEILRHAKNILFDNDWDRQSNWHVECQTDGGNWVPLKQFSIPS